MSPAVPPSRHGPAWYPLATASASDSDRVRERPAAPSDRRAPAAPPSIQPPERGRPLATSPPRSDPAAAEGWPARLTPHTRAAPPPARPDSPPRYPARRAEVPVPSPWATSLHHPLPSHR